MSSSLKELRSTAFSGCTGLSGPFTVALRRNPSVYIPGIPTSTFYVIPRTNVRIYEAWSTQDVTDFNRNIIRDILDAY
jgi:hypothetical protein